MLSDLQRVLSASVTVDGETVSSISRGLLVLVGIGKDDGPSDSEYIANKILSLRLFDSEDNRWRKNVKDIDGEILCVSQFTLLANTSKGNKPDFRNAMGGEPSKGIYTNFLTKLGDLYQSSRVKDGKFGAMMNVCLTNDGPVTIILDSNSSSSSSRKGQVTESVPTE